MDVYLLGFQMRLLAVNFCGEIYVNIPSNALIYRIWLHEDAIKNHKKLPPLGTKQKGLGKIRLGYIFHLNVLDASTCSSCQDLGDSGSYCDYS